jgi:hypothetical protein
MPTQVDTPIATTATNDWGSSGAANKMLAVATDDANRSFIYASSGGRNVKQHFAFPPYSAIVDPVNSASLTARARRYLKGGGARTFYLRWNGADVGTNWAARVNAVYPNYRTATEALAGANLALAAVNGEHGCRFSAAGGPSNKGEYWVTHLYRTIDFDYPSGSADSFAHNIATWAGLAIGAGLLLREMPALAAYIWARGRILLRPDEYERAWRAWKAQKRLEVV